MTLSSSASGAILAVMRSRSLNMQKTEWEVMLNMDDDSFCRHFGVVRRQYDYLLVKLQEHGLSSEHHQGMTPVPAPKKLLMFLWYMANQTSYREISKKFKVSQSSAHRVILQVLKCMSGVGTTFISWPNSSKKKSSASAFQRLCGVEGVIGAIDGCHIRVQRPAVRGGDYMNEKSYYSVLLQGIVDEQGCFIDIFAGPPGRVDDTRMLRASTFFTEWQKNMGEYHLLGDSTYDHQDFPFIVTPKHADEELTKDDLQHNAKIGRGRVVVDQAFGRMKCKWRRLRDLQTSRIDSAVMIIMAGCFLHNLRLGSSDVCEEHPSGCPRQEDDNV